MDETTIARRGLMLVLSSPSGAGKTTLSRMLLAVDRNLIMSISATTRQKRPGEEEGRDYYFTTETDFGQMMNRGEFLEHAKVFSNYYGTPKRPVEDSLNQGRDVLFDIDWQGTQQIKEAAREDVVSIFILPPSSHELEERLRRRAQDPDHVVAERMAKASDEISHYAEYDYIILNRDLEESHAQIQAILTAERLRRDRQTGLGTFVKGLRAGL